MNFNPLVSCLTNTEISVAKEKGSKATSLGERKLFEGQNLLQVVGTS